MEIHVLASGSKGNITFVNDGFSNFFIDAGISYQRTVKKMNAIEVSILDVDTIFLTHEHHDHTYGLKTMLKKGHIKHIYATQGTIDALNGEIKPLLPEVHIIKADVWFTFDGYQVLPIMVSHDASEPVGYIFKHQTGKSFTVITDTGYVDQAYHEALKGLDLYIVESNHDPLQLQHSLRPYALKQRILGITGHLSNEDASILINQSILDKAIWVVAHMSEDCNDQFEVEKAIVKYFDNPLKVDVKYASQLTLEKIVL